MKKLCVISMLVLGIVGNTFCQKTKSKYDTMTVLEGIRPPIMVNDFARKSDIYFNEEVKKNLNNLVIDFGDKNRLLINYQGIKGFELKQNVDSLLRSFWQDYSLIRDTLKQNTVKKITYYGKNKNVNRKAMIDIQYFPQKEVFQFGKEVELVRLQQDTLVLINFDDKASAELVKTANRVFKTYQSQSFLFNLNAIDDVENILENNINQAIIEASERIENERKTVKPWKILGVVNDLASQRIRSKVKGNALFDLLKMHADIGVGVSKGNFQGSTIVAAEICSSKYLNKGFLLGIYSTTTYIETKPKLNTYFLTGILFYAKGKPRVGLGLGVMPFSSVLDTQKTIKTKVMGWYQITPLIKIQGDFFEMNFSKKYLEYNQYFNLRLAFGF